MRNPLFRLKIKMFFFTQILCLIAISFPSIAISSEPVSKTNFLLVSDSQEKNSIKLVDNLKRALQCAGHTFVEVDVTALPGMTRKDFTESALILCCEKAASQIFPPDALSYVQDGGILYFAYRCFHPELMNPLGMKARDGPHMFVDARGLEAHRPFFRQCRPELQIPLFVSNGCNIDVSQEWEVQLNYKNPPNIPLLLTRSFGKGQVIFWNSSCLQMKEFRGLFLFSLLRSLPIAAMSVFNRIILQIDDSPPPAYDLKRGVVARDFGFSDFQFYQNIFYEQVMQLLEELAVPATHFLIFNYQDQIRGPFNKTIDRLEFFDNIIKKILNTRGHDLGLHGYNHQSLMLTGTTSRSWPSIEEMSQSLQQAFSMWQEKKLPPCMVYVPPNNLIDNAGKQAILNAFPTICTICRVYTSGNDYRVEAFNRDGGGDEFGPDEKFPRLLLMPRISSGFYLTELVRFSVLNGILTHGVFSHFIHPDDIYDSVRAKSNWEIMLLNLRRLLLFAKENLPAAEATTAGKFMLPMKKYFEENIHFEQNSTCLKVIQQKGFREFFYVFSRDASGDPVIHGGKLIATLEPNRLFLVKAVEPTMEILFSH
ncbi:MAG: DUF2194 domain-containing protein [Candidatus Riflebacteria bacterium]|nr:DUF2194 domain-containing protein [Candidatus Riflebacteria bacterium]